MAGRPVRISIIANGRQARAELQRTGASVEGLNKTIGRAGKLIGGALAVSTIARVGKAVLANGDAYTSQLNKIGALTTAQQRAQVGGLSGVAKQLEASKGAYAKYGNTVADAAGGLTELVKAGQTLPQALRSVNATLVLAKAGEMGVADASGLVSTALKDFHLPAKRAGDIANYLANAANISTSDVTDLGEALKFVGPVAHDVGISAQQTAAFLAQLSNAGIKGTMAGEGLRRVMLSLQSPTGKAQKAIEELGLNVFDAEGKARPFAAVLDDLSGKLASLTDKQRKADLRAIFGLTGVTSAQVLLDNVKSLGSYTKGVERAGAAQKLAEANSKGLVGTLRRAGALLQSSGQAAYRAFSPLVDNALRPMVDWLDRNDQALGAQARTVASRAVPAMKSLANVVEDTGKAVVGVTDDLKPFLPLLGEAADIAKAAADGLHAIPVPIKTLAIEAGIAALVLPRLSTGVASVTSNVTRQTGVLRMWSGALLNAETRSTALGLAGLKLAAGFKTAAGIGGMLALTKSAGETNKSLATLERVGGAAALGFSVGGPWGAAVGGTIGLLVSLKSAFGQTADEAKQAAREAGSARSWSAATAAIGQLTIALHGTVKAYNEVTAASVQKGFRDANGNLLPWVKALQDAGVSMDTLTRATLGQADAQKVLARGQGQVGSNLLFRKGAVAQAAQELAGYQAQLRALDQQIAGQGHGATSPQLAEQARLNALIATGRKSVSDTSNAYRDYKAQVDSGNDALRRLGVTVAGQSALEAKLRSGLGLTKRAYDALPRSARFKLETDRSIPQTKTELLDFIKTAKLTPKQVATVVRALGIPVTKKDLQSVGVAVDKIPRSAFTKVGVLGGQSAASAAGRFGASAGSSFGAGYVGGIAAWAGRAEFAAAAMAARAHAAAMRAQQSHSPSKKTRRLGQWFAQGFALGIRDDASKVIDAVDTLYGKVDKKQRPAIRKLVAQYTQGKKGLNAIAAAQAKVNNALDDAKQKLGDAKQAWKDYAAGVKAGVVAFGDITEVGKNGAGNASADSIVSGLRTRASAVQQYVTTVRQLIGQKLNATALQQILDKGVDGGLQTALAIEQGGAGTISQINALQAQIDAAAGSLGNAASHRMNDAGVQAAQGLYNGLVADQKRLERTATALANALIKAIKKKLGIKSPSTVFRDIGRYTVKGLNIGLDQRVIGRAGAQLATSLRDGFGTPALDAVLSPSLSAAQQTQNVRITLSAPQRDALLQGRDVILDIAAAASTGGARALA